MIKLFAARAVCEWCGSAHDPAKLCTARPGLTRRRFLFLGAAAAVGALVADRVGLLRTEVHSPFKIHDLRTFAPCLDQPYDPRVAEALVRMSEIERPYTKQKAGPALTGHRIDRFRALTGAVPLGRAHRVNNCWAVGAIGEAGLLPRQPRT